MIFGKCDLVCGLVEVYLKYIGGVMSFFNVWVMFKLLDIMVL